MSVNLLSEHVIPISAAGKLIPGKPSVRTIYRWLDRGLLKSFCVRSRRFTSREEIGRFLEAEASRN